MKIPRNLGRTSLSLLLCAVMSLGTVFSAYAVDGGSIPAEDNTTAAANDAAAGDNTTAAVNDAAAEDNTTAAVNDAAAEDNTTAAANDAAAGDNTTAANDAAAEDNTTSTAIDAPAVEPAVLAEIDTTAGGIAPPTGPALTPSKVLSHLGSYSTGSSSQDGGAAEIVAYNPENKNFYVVNGIEKKLDIVSLATLDGTKNNQKPSAAKSIDVSKMVDGFAFGDLTSVAVDIINKRIAVAVQAEAYDEAGRIIILDYDGKYQGNYKVGIQPDMVTFSPDGKYALSANEGEARKGYAAGTDPKGSVTIVDLDKKIENTVDFTAWDSRRDELVKDKVIVKKGLNPSTDFEPEYIAVSSDSKTAYVALQEANAIAVLDIAKNEFTAISSLGLKDHRIDGNELDAFKDKKIQIKKDNFLGVPMADGIAIYEVNGKTYLLTANEGDATEWAEYTNLTTTAINGQTMDVLDWRKLDGLEEPKNGEEYLMGGRSFSIYEVTAKGLDRVFDSGSDFERVTAQVYPKNFNASNKNNKLDSRSDAKGPEPESVTVTKVGNKTYAYIGLERIGGVMLYDITNPQEAVFCDYINSRNFEVDFPKKGTDPAQGDVGAEGLCVIPAAKSPTGYPIVLTANEVSGTVAIYQQNEGKYTAPSAPKPPTSGGGGGGGRPSSKPPQTPAKPAEPVAPAKPADPAAPAAPDATGHADGNAKPAGSTQFKDVQSAQWYGKAVQYVYEKGLMSGTGNDAFSPNVMTTRAMIVSILYKLAGAPKTDNAAAFSDVQTGKYYADAVAWASDNKIISGYGQGKFGPDDKITREQMALILYKYASYKGYDVSKKKDLSGYADSGKTHSYAKDALAWANAEGLINGMSDTTLAPDGKATRAQMAAILMQFCEGVAK